jgi:hypothetical protein
MERAQRPPKFRTHDDAEAKIADLEQLWRDLSVECIDLRKKVERVEAGRKVVLRALREVRDALRVGRAKEAPAIVEEALDE